MRLRGSKDCQGVTRERWSHEKLRMLEGTRGDRWQGVWEMVSDWAGGKRQERQPDVSVRLRVWPEANSERDDASDWKITELWMPESR